MSTTITANDDIIANDVLSPTNLTATASYYLVISCTNGTQTIFSVQSNVVQIAVTYPQITIGVKEQIGFDTTSTAINPGAKNAIFQPNLPTRNPEIITLRNVPTW